MTTAGNLGSLRNLGPDGGPTSIPSKESPPSDTTWPRLAHRVDPANGEHESRAATSRDSENFVWCGTWTLPSGTEPRIGLLSLGKAQNDPAATSRFDYFRVYRP